jgi:Tol biopolymer transport system component
VNSEFEELAPHLSSDGLALYFSSTRPGGQGGEDLWVARRSNRHAPWGPATNVGPMINTSANERSPALSRNQRLLFFATDRAGDREASTSGSPGAPIPTTISAGRLR